MEEEDGGGRGEVFGKERGRGLRAGSRGEVDRKNRVYKRNRRNKKRRDKKRRRRRS